MELGRRKRFLQSFRVNTVRLVKHSIDENSSFIAIPLKSSFSRPLTFPRFLGKLSNFEHPERSRELPNFKLQMALGRQTRFLQLFRVNLVRLVKRSIDEGDSRPLTFPRFSGNFSIFVHQARSRKLPNFKHQMVLGRQTRFLQSLRVYKVRFVKCSIDEGADLW